VLLDVLARLVIELDQAVHCNGDRDRFKDDSLPIEELISKRNTIYPATSKHTQICEKAGLRDASQYKPKACVTTATIVMTTRITQYWKTPAQTICITVSTETLPES
jgi:hypothetical protein